MLYSTSSEGARSLGARIIQGPLYIPDGGCWQTLKGLGAGVARAPWAVSLSLWPFCVVSPGQQLQCTQVRWLPVAAQQITSKSVTSAAYLCLRSWWPGVWTRFHWGLHSSSHKAAITVLAGLYSLSFGDSAWGK